MTEIPTLWTPPNAIRPIAIGLLRHLDALLVMRVADAAGVLVGMRPPGGGVEFGERAEDALHREFREEFDAAVSILGPPVVLENLYAFNGAPGHEIVFAYPIASADLIASVVDKHVVQEENGSRAVAEWIKIDRLIAGDYPLFPPGLIELFTSET